MKKSYRIGLATVVCAAAIVTGSCARSAQSSLDRGNSFLAKGDVAAAILEYRAAVERLNLDIMEIVQGNGSGFAFPSQTVYLARDGAPQAR